MSQARKSKEIKLPKTTLSIDAGSVHSTEPIEFVKVSPNPFSTNLLRKKVQILLKWLAEPKTRCIFWEDHNGSVDIVGLRPVIRTTLETINAGGFTPHEKKKEERLFKFYLIDIVDNNDKYIWSKEDEEKREIIEQNGSIYLKSENIKYIYDFIRKNS